MSPVVLSTSASAKTGRPSRGTTSGALACPIEDIRLSGSLREVRVYDYVDDRVPVLQRMSEKRVRGYANLGYTVESSALADSCGAGSLNVGSERSG